MENIHTDVRVQRVKNNLNELSVLITYGNISNNIIEVQIREKTTIKKKPTKIKASTRFKYLAPTH